MTVWMRTLGLTMCALAPCPERQAVGNQSPDLAYTAPSLATEIQLDRPMGLAMADSDVFISQAGKGTTGRAILALDPVTIFKSILQAT